MQPRDQFVLGELQRVGAGHQRQQPALMHQVVHDHDFTLVVGGAELAALQAVAHRDVQRHPRGRGGMPPTVTRPRISVPSMVKNRRLGFSIGEE